MNYKNIMRHLLILSILFTITSCVPAEITTHEYGFFAGIWHSLIFPFSAIGKILGLNTTILAANNTGFSYYTGFILCSIVEVLVLFGLSKS